MRFRSTVVLCALYLSIACKIERNSTPDAHAAGARSESTKLALSSDPVRLASNLAVPVDSLRAAGEERYARGAYDTALAIWNVELVRAKSARDQRAAARVQTWLGLAEWKLGDFKSSRIHGEKSLAMKRQLGMDSEIARSFNSLGLLAWHEGRLRDALLLFDSTKAAATRNHDAAILARALANIPLVRVELGDFDAARSGFVTALAAARQIDDERIQGNVLANLAMLEIRLGNASRAVNILSEARAHYTKIDYKAGEANALGQAATAWADLGDLQRAIASADSALTIARAEGLQQEVAAELEVLADLHMKAGSRRLALRRLAEADSIDAALGLLIERGADLRRMAAILTELGEYQTAIARARSAVGLHRSAEALAEEIYDHLQLAQSFALARRPSEARAQADSAASLAPRTGNLAVTRDVAGVAARLALDSRNPREALANLQRAGARGSSDWKLADLRAEALLAMGRLGEAQTEGEHAIAALERERGSLGSGPLRSVYLASRSSPFSHLVAIHLARHDTTAAFNVAASLPGRNLSERFGGFVDAPRSLTALAEGERLLLRAATLERELSELEPEDATAERARTLDGQLIAVRSAYEEQLARQASLPQASMLGLVRATRESVQSELDHDEAVLLLLSGPDHLDAFVVTKAFVRQTSVSIGSRALAQRVRVVRQLLAEPVRAPVPEALGELYEILLGGAERDGALKDVKRLYIVPHGALGALPFAALWNRRTGKFLIEERSLAYLPALSALGGAAQNRATTDRLAVFAPLPDSLPGTLREARAIQRETPGTEVHVGTASSEAGIKSALQNGLSVHIASHGSHNSQNPLFSRIVVGKQRGQSPSEDGRLDVWEILGLSTTARLIFLSGCETGLASGTENAFDQESEEGSLAQAFLSAGAQTVVATLWRVDDAQSADLATSFYRHTHSGAEAAEALAAAQREAIGSRRGYSWAAYTVSGTSSRKSRKAVRMTAIEPLD